MGYIARLQCPVFAIWALIQGGLLLWVSGNDFKFLQAVYFDFSVKTVYCKPGLIL